MGWGSEVKALCTNFVRIPIAVHRICPAFKKHDIHRDSFKRCAKLRIEAVEFSLEFAMLERDKIERHQDQGLGEMLLLYVWPFWMFLDCTKGTALERAIKYRHNQQMRVYLPGYALKWIAIACLLLFSGAAASSGTCTACLWYFLSTLLLTLFTFSFVVLVVIYAGYLLLSRDVSV